MKTLAYRGCLTHVRSHPVHHAFTYPTWMLCINLAELSTLGRALFGFGYNRFDLCSIRDRDYLFAGGESLTAKLMRCIEAAGAEVGEWSDTSRIWMLTMPRVLGLGFNPLSLYVRTDECGRVQAVVAEVHNTYGEVHAYVLPGEGQSMERQGGAIFYRFPKSFYVSPFNGLEGEYTLSIEEPFPRMQMRVGLDLDVGQSRVLRAVLALQGTALARGRLAALVARYPFDAAFTLPRIGWQALMLRWRRRLPFRLKPRPGSAMTIRTAGQAKRMTAHSVEGTK